MSDSTEIQRISICLEMITIFPGLVFWTTGSRYNHPAHDNSHQSEHVVLHPSVGTSYDKRSHPNTSKTPAILKTSPVLYGTLISTHFRSPPIYSMSKHHTDVCLALPHLQSFLSESLSPLFTIGLHILFSNRVWAVRSRWKVPCTSCCSCFNVSSRNHLSIWRKVFTHASSYRRKLWTARACRILYLLFTTSASYAKKCTLIVIYQFPTKSHAQHAMISTVSSHSFWLCAGSSQLCRFPNITNIFVIQNIASLWRSTMLVACTKGNFSKNGFQGLNTGAQGKWYLKVQSCVTSFTISGPTL